MCHAVIHWRWVLVPGANCVHCVHIDMANMWFTNNHNSNNYPAFQHKLGVRVDSLAFKADLWITGTFPMLFGL